MIERRLVIAKELLNPQASVLIATIDEKEYLRLGLLLEQSFPEARIQMLSSVINPKGVPRDGFSRVATQVIRLPELVRMRTASSRVKRDRRRNHCAPHHRDRENSKKPLPA
jgi:hypothetical protein